MSQPTLVQRSLTCQIAFSTRLMSDLTVIEVFNDRPRGKMDRSAGGKLGQFQAILYVIRGF